MPPKAPQKQQQRVHTTNKMLEAQQFSSVRLPRSSEAPVQKVNVDVLFTEPRQHGGDSAGTSSAPFDPIASDPMFDIVEHSKYWPPPSLAELQASTGVKVVGTDGFDLYDRREDDLQARKQHTKVVRGELNHPRGKPRQNTIVKLSDSDSSDVDKDDDVKDEAA